MREILTNAAPIRQDLIDRGIDIGDAALVFELAINPVHQVERCLKNWPTRLENREGECSG